MSYLYVLKIIKMFCINTLVADLPGFMKLTCPFEDWPRLELSLLELFSLL